MAIAQVVSGLDEEVLANMLCNVSVGVAVGSDASCLECRSAVDLLVRLLARLYPTMAFRDESGCGFDRKAASLARQINPGIDVSHKPTVEVAVGAVRGELNATDTFFAGCDGWTARLSREKPQSCGSSNNPFGAGLVACLAASEVFKQLFKPEAQLGHELELSIPPSCISIANRYDVEGVVGNLVLAGAGAIGNATAWALSRVQVRGTIDIVDDEAIDLGNLQRYVLAKRIDENKLKAEFVAEQFNGTLKANAHPVKISKYLELRNSRTDLLLLALDSAYDRRAAQASLPRRIANAWTQPNDLGVSVHNFLQGACVNCLYRPEGQQTNEDATLAECFGVMDRLMEVRSMLHKNEGAPRYLLEAISVARNVPLEKLLPFEGRSLRQLYSEGFCGGAVIPLKNLDAEDVDVHVPLAHQSAMAGVLLAAAAIRSGLGEPHASIVTQFDVLKPQTKFQSYPVNKDTSGGCICQDEDYIDVFLQKYVDKN